MLPDTNKALDNRQELFLCVFDICFCKTELYRYLLLFINIFIFETLIVSFLFLFRLFFSIIPFFILCLYILVYHFFTISLSFFVLFFYRIFIANIFWFLSFKNSFLSIFCYSLNCSFQCFLGFFILFFASIAFCIFACFSKLFRF